METNAVYETLFLISWYGRWCGVRQLWGEGGGWKRGRRGEREVRERRTRGGKDGERGETAVKERGRRRGKRERE